MAAAILLTWSVRTTPDAVKTVFFPRFENGRQKRQRDGQHPGERHASLSTQIGGFPQLVIANLCRHMHTGILP